MMIEQVKAFKVLVSKIEKKKSESFQSQFMKCYLKISKILKENL